MIYLTYLAFVLGHFLKQDDSIEIIDEASEYHYTMDVGRTDFQKYYEPLK